MSSPRPHPDHDDRRRAWSAINILSRGNDPERIVFFSDAVFAIAMTLLVLDLKVPEIGRDATAADVAAAVWSKFPAFLGFTVSFIIIAGLWQNHHNRFNRLRAYDSTLAVLNLAVLFFVAFLPMPTGLLFTAPSVTGLPNALYAAAIGCAYLMLDVEWWYAHRQGFLDPTVTPLVYRRTLLAMLPMMLTFLISAPIALIFGAMASYTVWFVGFAIHAIWERQVKGWAVRRQLDLESQGGVPGDDQLTPDHAS